MNSPGSPTAGRRVAPIRILLGLTCAILPAVVLYLYVNGRLDSFLGSENPSLARSTAGRSTANRGQQGLHPPNSDPSTFSPRQVVNEFPAVTGFRNAPLAEGVERLEDDELVLGVVVNGAARAYPINMMHGPQREIFNDELGGRPIAATW